MQLCACNRQGKRPRCSCKNFEKVASEGGSIFNEAMYTCECTVRTTFNKCDNKLHIQALDYRAATFEDIKELERAQKDAEWMLELAPRLPDGYLRLGKILRLQKKYEFAWKVYNAGIETGNNNHQAELPKFKKLQTARQPLHIRFYRRDPLKNPQRLSSAYSVTLISPLLCDVPVYPKDGGGISPVTAMRDFGALFCSPKNSH
ncbi:hypothetical protein NXS19_003565 [Fusarium pseudograminearum]|nr:hypothetical protein NXS19_003565 [Fusarium pseudograminearum]